MPRVLIVHREAGAQHRLARAIASEALIASTGDGERALELVAGHGFEVVVASPDVCDGHGASVVAQLRERHPEVELLVVGDPPGELDDAATARLAVRRALERQELRGQVRRLTAHVAALRGALDGARLDGLVAESLEMREVVALAARVAPTEAAVVIRGEPGTGRRTLADAIHHASARAQRRIVHVACGELAEWLFEPALFGHTDDAFAGQGGARRGVLDEAHRGTLVLDDVEQLAPGAQVRIARALGQRAFRPVGDHAMRPLDVRVIATTSGTSELVPELRYLLDVVAIDLAPLRARRADIAALATRFLHRHRRDGQAAELSPGALRALADHGWPGNAAELEDAVRRALATTRRDTLSAASFRIARRRASRA